MTEGNLSRLQEAKSPPAPRGERKQKAAPSNMGRKTAKTSAVPPKFTRANFPVCTQSPCNGGRTGHVSTAAPRRTKRRAAKGLAADGPFSLGGADFVIFPIIAYPMLNTTYTTVQQENQGASKVFWGRWRRFARPPRSGSETGGHPPRITACFCLRKAKVFQWFWMYSAILEWYSSSVSGIGSAGLPSSRSGR